MIDVIPIYNIINAKYFDNTLPQNIKIEWSDKMNRHVGMCYWKEPRIVLNSYYFKKYPEDIEAIMIHEMVHLKVPNHRKMFIAEMERIKSMGARVLYKGKQSGVKFKWEYKCTFCPETYKRFNRKRSLICPNCTAPLIERKIED